MTNYSGHRSDAMFGWWPISLNTVNNMSRNYYDLWSFNDKTPNGTRIFVDLKSSGKLKITLSKPLGNGKYDREELFIPEQNIAALRDTLNNNVTSKTPTVAKPTAKTYSLDDIRKQQGQSAYMPWTNADDAELKRLHGEGLSMEQLAVHFKRGVGAIKSRLSKLGF